MKRTSKELSGDTIAARVAVSEMLVDEYQGHVNHALVDRIAKEWDESAAGAVILNMRDTNVFAVLDGQHRVLAAQKANVYELNALVFVGKTREEEAKLFVQLNTKHNVRPMDRFRANLFAGSVREKNISRACNELGLTIKDTWFGHGVVRSVVGLQYIYDSHGLSHLKAVLGTLQAAFRSYDDNLAYSDAALRAMSAFIYRYPEASIPRLIDKLSKHTPTTINGMSVQRIDPGQSAWMGWGKVFTSLYNAGFRAGSEKFLPMDRWNKAVYSPKGRESQRAKAKSRHNLDHLSKFRFKKGFKPSEQPVVLRAAAKSGPK